MPLALKVEHSGRYKQYYFCLFFLDYSAFSSFCLNPPITTQPKKDEGWRLTFMETFTCAYVKGGSYLAEPFHQIAFSYVKSSK